MFYKLYCIIFVYQIKTKMKDTVSKFVGRKTIQLNENEILLCNEKLQGTELKFSENSIYSGRIFTHKIDNIRMNGKHNYWGTNGITQSFKAVAKRMTCYVLKKEGVIETDEIFKYVEGSEGTICYSVSLKLYGDFRYKYQRGWHENVEIYSYYDYDDNLNELLGRLKNYYNELIKDL